MKNKCMLKRYLISPVLSYLAVSDYGTARIVSELKSFIKFRYFN